MRKIREVTGEEEKPDKLNELIAKYEAQIDALPDDEDQGGDGGSRKKGPDGPPPKLPSGPGGIEGLVKSATKAGERSSQAQMRAEAYDKDDSDQHPYPIDSIEPFARLGPRKMETPDPTDDICGPSSPLKYRVMNDGTIVVEKEIRKEKVFKQLSIEKYKKPSDTRAMVPKESAKKLKDLINEKEEDLKHKLKIKQNLRKLMSVARDSRFDNFDEYLRVVMQQHNDYFHGELTAKSNLKTVVNQQKGLSLSEKNKIFKLHNGASNSEVYGAELYDFVSGLVRENKAPQGFDEQVYVLSVDWPLDMQIEYEPVSPETEDHEQHFQ